MSTLADLVHAAADLDEDAIGWLHALVAEWQLLADLSFSDLSLWVRVREEHEAAGSFLAVAQVRPATGPTAYQEDLVGSLAPTGEAVPLERVWRSGRIAPEGRGRLGGRPVRLEVVPVRTRHGVVVAVLARASDPDHVRTPSQLELTYLGAAAELTLMVEQGRFPHPDGEGSARWESGPRVGDGLIRLDDAGRVQYASPNALSAYRRLGVAANLLGKHLGDLTGALVADAGVYGDPQVGAVLRGRWPGGCEVEAGSASVQLRSLPLLPDGEVTGALVLVRDVTELRRRDRALLSKDATIREIHHRVKNNLQTVAALLRLQARRLEAPEARAALEESMRRVSSIALVHETLSLTLDESVAFDEIADRVVAMVADVVLPDQVVATRRIGSFGMLPAQVATPLALVLTELLHNAVEHAFDGRPGSVELRAEQREGRLVVTVADDGAGLPSGFSLDHSAGLGLQIVRALVETELSGRLSIRPRAGPGTAAELDVPVVP